MIILKEIGTAQTFKIIPTRGSVVNKLSLRNETTNEVIDYDIISTSSSFFITITEILDLKDGHFYEASFYESIPTFDDVLVHKDRIFCTNQTIANYTINKNEYIASTDNIIFYE